MGFLKNLFNKGESFVPTPTQSIPGLEPIVVQAIENLFPDTEDQKKAFTYALDFKGSEYAVKRFGTSKNNLHALLALLAMSNGKIGKLPDWSDPLLSSREIFDTFLTMKKAEAWVKSITKSQG
jgi:hypothetical protein